MEHFYIIGDAGKFIYVLNKYMHYVNFFMLRVLKDAYFEN